jgi:hypothetical protein
MWGKCGAAELKSDLVVALASGSVCKVGDFALERSPDETLADDGTREASSVQVAALVLQTARNSRPSEITHKFTSQVIYDDLKSFVETLI